MRLVTPSLVVQENDSFTNDLLGRKAYGEALLNLVVRSSDELVISLDGKWGEGKTTFIKMWQGLLSENGIPNIYIDAFSNDYLDDAFISVISEITFFSEKHIVKDHQEKIEELKKKSKKIGVQLLSWSTKLGIKAATLGIIKDADIEELKDIKSDISKSFSTLVSDFIEERINSHSKDVALIESFKELLSSLPAKLVKDEEKPLIVIIDELDRCKPTFAVDLVEKIKHLFSVKNVVFILVMNKSQLEESIKSVYGQNIDAHTYLQKFINIETKLPKRTSERHDNDLKKYSGKLFKLHELETWGDERNIIDCIEPLATHFNLSLRQLEKVYTNLAVFYGSSSENHLRLVPVIVFLAVLKVINPYLFERLLYNKSSYTELITELNFTDINEYEENNHSLYWIMNWIRYASLSEKEFNELPQDDEIKKYGDSLWKYHVRRERLIPIFAQLLSIFVVE